MKIVGLSMTRISLYTAVAIVLLVCTVTVFAHKAILWAEVKDNKVHVEAYFSGGGKVKNARIVVMNADKQQLLEGKTDANGQFNFTPPNRDDMTIVLIVDEGHQDEFELKAEELAAVELQ
jgi:nickel transport protein